MNFSLRAIALLALLGAASLLRAQDKGGSDPFSVDDPAAKPAAPAGEGVSPAPPPADEPALPDILPASPPKPAESKPAEAKPDGPPPSAPKPPEAAAPPAGGNLVPNSNFDKKNEKGEPRDWAFRHFHGKEAADSAGVVPEGREKDPCLKVSFTEPTSSSFATKVRLKPDTDYVFGGWIKTDGVSPEGKETLGAMIQIGSLADPSHKFSSDFLFGTHDWMEVKGKLHTGDSPQEYFLLCLLGGEGESKGTAWFDSVYLRENRIPYRRPALERSVFNREGVSLDKDQAAELATALGSLVCNFPEQGAVQKLDFKSCALGVALTLDPRNRIAVVVNSQLEEGRTPRSTDAFTDFSSLCRFFDELSSFLLGKDTTPDDRALGLYLADILWQIAPSSASGAQYAKLRDSGRGADWSPILPPPPKPAETETGGKEPEVAGHPNKGSEGTPANPDGTGPRIEPGPDYPGPAAKLAVGSAFARPNATFRTVVLAGGPGTRAALRAINLSWRDYKVEQHYSDKEGRNVDTRVPLESKGRAEAVFRDHMGSVIRDIWSQHVLHEFGARFDGWPTRGEVDVTIAGYSETNGSSAALATAMAWESMMRGVDLNPKVAAIGTWTDKGKLKTHSHVPDILVGYGKNWSDILLVGPGNQEKIADATIRGYILPLLSTQVIEVRNYAEAMDIASGKIAPDTKASIDGVAQVLALRAKMDAATMIKNKFVLDRLKSLAESNPRNLTPALLLRAAENQKKLSAQESAEELGKLFRWLEQMAESDIEWIPEAEGMEAIEIFNDRLREIKPRMDPSINRLNIRLDESIKALTEMVKTRDRTTATAVRKAETTREIMAQARQAIDAAAVTQ